MLGHQLLVHARPVVEALQVRGRDEPQEVAVARLVVGEQCQVVVLLLVLTGVAIEPRAGRHVGLHADDRRDGGHLELGGTCGEVRDAARTVEDRVLGVDVEVDEARVRQLLGPPVEGVFPSCAELQMCDSRGGST